MNPARFVDVDYTTHTLPEFHFNPEHMMSWNIVDGVLHLHVEEPWGIIGLDFKATIALLNDGALDAGLDYDNSESMLSADAVSVDDVDVRFEVCIEEAVDTIRRTPYSGIRDEFPNIAI